MTIRQLELFVQVYELRNLTRAAESLYMTQSAATQNLKKTEEELGIRLFERSNRQVVPTQAGDRFYQHARKIITEYKTNNTLFFTCEKVLESRHSSIRSLKTGLSWI